MSQTEQKFKKQDLTLELLGFPKTIFKKIRECSKIAESAPKDISYLWLKVSEKNIKSNEKKQGEKLNIDVWLNVIDEAVSAGANWLVLTIHIPLDQMEEVIEMCRWAQNTYTMRVGFFLCREDISEKEIRVISGLKKDLTQIFVKKKALEHFKKLKEMGLFLGIADPQEYGNKPNCEGASKLLYVDNEGSIYTCGLVSGMKNYKLGTIYEKKFQEIIKDPSLPHSVEEKIHKVNEGCDGCPSLLMKYLKK